MAMKLSQSSPAYVPTWPVYPSQKQVLSKAANRQQKMPLSLGEKDTLDAARNLRSKRAATLPPSRLFYKKELPLEAPDEIVSFRPTTPLESLDVEQVESIQVGRRRRKRNEKWKPTLPRTGLKIFSEEHSIEKFIQNRKDEREREFRTRQLAHSIKKNKAQAKHSEETVGSFPYLLPSKQFTFNEGSTPSKLQKHFAKKERRYLMKHTGTSIVSVEDVLNKFHDFVMGNLQVF